MWAILPYLLPLGMVIAANWGTSRRPWKIVTYLSLTLLDTVALAAGVLLLAGSYLLRRSGQPLGAELQGSDVAGLGRAVLLAALAGFACLLRPVRRSLTRWLRIDPASPVHTVALTFVVFLAATSVGLLLTSQNLVNFSLATATPDPVGLVTGEVVFVLFALAGVGLATRHGVRVTLTRLGLQMPKIRHLAMAVVMMIALLALDYVTSLLWHRWWPDNYRMVAESSKALFVRFSSPSGALLLAISAALGEETLFRGALQPRLRVPLTAALFAVSHVQYALSPAILEIFIVGLALGWLREKSNTTACMLVHAGYNFLDVLLIPWLP